MGHELATLLLLCSAAVMQYITAAHVLPTPCRYIPGPKQIIELDVGGFMLGELVAFALAFPVQVGSG